MSEAQAARGFNFGVLKVKPRIPRVHNDLSDPVVVAQLRESALRESREERVRRNQSDHRSK
ncbi:hypothetical protein [Subtercola boreus]|uniref:hypothetical protein n=1 Tax=Subtercola boreus TaxID=120213 RepID=UPI0011C05F1A|nr:hypothetical protein [Subtercola boreus]